MQPATLQPSTAELLEQRNGPIGSLKGHLTRQPLLKATAGIRAQANAAGAATHRLRREHRRLQPDGGGAVVDGAGGSADHPGQGHGLVGVADDERVGAQVVGGAIESGEGLAVPGRTQIEHGRIEATRANVSEAVAIKRMQGLAQLQHHQIGDVHHVVDRPQAGTLQPLLQPQRRGANLQIAQRREAEQTARFDAVLHSGRHRQIAGCHGRGCRRQVERAASEGGHLASDTAHRQAIGSVGGDRQLQHLIIEAE